VGKRLFIAVDIDASTRDQIGRISTGLREAVGHTNASWVRPDRMHLTLQFFGSADAALEERVRATLARPIAEAPFDLSLGGVGVFPERGSPRVLWIGVVDGVEQLRRLHATLPGRTFGPVLPESTNQPFTPHLTLARLRERAPRTKFAEITDIPASAGPSRIDRVTLYESRLSPAGPTYIPLAEALLQP
jgi:RNA 2',3'-cyclic 3'-phosphodiesterase